MADPIILPAPSTDIANAIRELTAEIKLLREAWLASPGMEMSEIALAQVKAQMRGGIVAAEGILKPNH